MNPKELLTDIIDDLIGAARSNRANLMAFANQRYQKFLDEYSIQHTGVEDGGDDEGISDEAP